VLEQREFERVGGVRTLPMKARIISATNRDLKEALRSGGFREDFYYRLRTVPIHIPPLRQRREDIPLLVECFIDRLNRLTQKCVRGVDAKVMDFLMDYDWPGNVRELERTLEYAFVFVKGATILRQNLPEAEEFGSGPSAETGAPNGDPRSRETILWALSRAGGKKQEAARMLGLSRTTLWRRIKNLGID
jgi:transcriptional regulator with PAS, ATPase and Fis domain